MIRKKKWIFVQWYRYYPIPRFFLSKISQSTMNILLTYFSPVVYITLSSYWYNVLSFSAWTVIQNISYLLLTVHVLIFTNRWMLATYLIIWTIDPANKSTNKLIHLRTAEGAVWVAQVWNQILVGLNPLPGVLSGHIGKKGIQSCHFLAIIERYTEIKHRGGKDALKALNLYSFNIYITRDLLMSFNSSWTQP